MLNRYEYDMQTFADPLPDVDGTVYSVKSALGMLSISITAPPTVNDNTIFKLKLERHSVASPDPRGWGQRLGGLGKESPSGAQGQSPGEGLGAKPPEADAYTQIYSCEKSLFSL